jgi:predicted RNase H-like HicB family nuclease
VESAIEAGDVAGGGRYTRPMSEALQLTIVYEREPDGEWIVVSIPEVPGVLSQGKTKEEARKMVLDALAGMLEFRASEYEPHGGTIERESLDIVAA